MLLIAASLAAGLPWPVFKLMPGKGFPLPNDDPQSPAGACLELIPKNIQIEYLS